MIFKILLIVLLLRFLIILLSLQEQTKITLILAFIKDTFMKFTGFEHTQKVCTKRVINTFICTLELLVSKIQ